MSTFFPSLDGIPLEEWFIPADSDKLLVVNHPMTCNRYGFPGHLPPWNTMFGGFEVNFLPEFKHLHDVGYNILTYDLSYKRESLRDMCREAGIWRSDDKGALFRQDSSIGAIGAEHEGRRF